MNARQAAEINQEKTEDLLNSSIEMAKKNNISVLDAIDKKVQVYQRYSKNATESTAWQLRGDNAKEIYLKQENNINQEQTNKSIDYSKIWNETKFVDRKDPIFSDELTTNDKLFKNAINVIDKFREEPDLLKEISINAWNNYVKNELDYPPVEPDFSEVVAEYDVDMDYAEQVWEATLEDFKDEMEAYEKKWKLSDRNSFIQEKYSNEVEVLQKFYTTNYDLAEKRLEFIENILKELGKENNIELKNISVAKQENTQPTNIQLGDKFLFDNKPYEVYHIREQHDPKIYLEHTAENGIRDELTYYQSDIVKALKENKIEMIDKRELIENEVTNHDIIKMWADKPEQEQNRDNSKVVSNENIINIIEKKVVDKNKYNPLIAYENIQMTALALDLKTNLKLNNNEIATVEYFKNNSKLHFETNIDLITGATQTKTSKNPFENDPSLNYTTILTKDLRDERINIINSYNFSNELNESISLNEIIKDVSYNNDSVSKILKNEIYLDYLENNKNLYYDEHIDAIENLSYYQQTIDNSRKELNKVLSNLESDDLKKYIDIKENLYALNYDKSFKSFPVVQSSMIDQNLSFLLKDIRDSLQNIHNNTKQLNKEVKNNFTLKNITNIVFNKNNNYIQTTTNNLLEKNKQNNSLQNNLFKEIIDTPHPFEKIISNNNNQENNMKENTTKTDEVLNIYNNLNSETKNLLKQNFWAEQERHTNWHNSDYSDTREQDKLEKLFDNANNFIKAEYKEAKEKIFNTIEYTDFYEIVINNPNLKDNVNQEQQNKEFNLSEFLADVKANFSAEEKAYLREKLLINFRQNEFSPITFQKNSNISKEGIEKVENFYNKFEQENYTLSEKDLKEYGSDYASFYADENFKDKVDDILKAMHYDEDIRIEINKVYLNTKKNINSKQENNMENNVNQEQQKNNQIKDILTDIKNNYTPANNLLRREIELGAEKAFTQIGIENNLFSTKDIDDRVAEISKTEANIETDFGNLDHNQAQEFVKKAHELKNLNFFNYQKPNKQELQTILDVFKPGETIQSIVDKYKQENPTVAPQNLPVDGNLQKLQDKVKYLGLGDTQEMRDKIAQIYHGDLGKSQINTSSDRVMAGNKAEFVLNFNKTEKGVFFNSYNAKLTTKQGEERSHTFNVQNSNVTSKEAINLLEGRAVKMNFQKLDTETGEITENQAFIKLKLKDEKTDNGNYKLEGYNVNAYGIDIDKIMEKSNIKGAPQELENVKKHLEKGNITSVTFEHEQKEIKGYAVFNPQWKMLNLYDEKMSRVNSNKQSIEINTEQNQKNNVIQQKNSRSL